MNAQRSDLPENVIVLDKSCHRYFSCVLRNPVQRLYHDLLNRVGSQSEHQAAVEFDYVYGQFCRQPVALYRCASTIQCYATTNPVQGIAQYGNFIRVLCCMGLTDLKAEGLCRVV